MKTIQSTRKLKDGVEIPCLGLGTWQSRGQDCIKAVQTALDLGYAHIDTAQGYDNEIQVGLGIKASGRSRNEIFITTKISNANQGYQKTKESFKQSLADLQTDYVDLLLIHWPDIKHFELTIETWQTLVDLQKEGLCRSIGVSNFTIDLIKKLTRQIDVIPSINQVEFHPFLYQQELLNFCNEQHIQVEAYSPIARAKFFNHKQLQKVAQKHGKTPAQIMLAWGIHHGLVVIPKSTHKGRIEENSDIFFPLDKDDMEILDNLQPQVRLVDGSWAPPNW